MLRARPIIDIITTVTGVIKDYDELRNIDPTKVGCPKDENSKLVCFSFKACFQFNSNLTIRISQSSYLRLRYRIEAETFTGK